MSQRADYSYNLNSLFGQKFIIISEKELGHRTIKEDIINVVAEIIINDTRIENPEEDWRVLYEDANGGWHGYDQTTKETHHFYHEETVKDAMEAYLELDRTLVRKSCKTETNNLITADTYISSNFL